MILLIACPKKNLLNLTIFTNKRHTVLKADEHEKFIGERGRRGAMLSRNFRNVIRISSETK